MIRKLLHGLLAATILFSAMQLHAQSPAAPVTGQITAQTTNATCVGGVQVGGAVDQPLNSSTNAVGISVTGTWAATLNIQLSVDHGKTWTASGGTFTTNQQSVVSTAGYSDACVFASAFTSGTIIVTFATSSASPSSGGGTGGSATQVQGNAGAGSPPGGNPVLVAGKDGSGNVQTLLTTAPSGGTGTLSIGSILAVASNASAESASAAPGFNSIFPAVSGGNVLLAVQNFGVDPCQASGVTKSHAFATITTATTTALVAVSGSTIVYVCEIDFGITGTTTAGTVLFEQGTGVACASSPVSLTATYTDAGTSITDIFTRIGSGAATAIKTAASNGLCAVTTVGTAPSIPVDVTYVQQ